jgi:prepilin-type N-terminal cleavage/methylation domain-containing protein
MKKELYIISQNRGATLIELLIALAITGVVTMSVMKLYVTQHENYLVQDDITTVQQNARASIDELTRNIRMAGNELPGSLPALIASNTNPDTLTVNFVTTNCETSLSTPMPNTSAELKCTGDISCYEDDQWVYIYEPDSGGGEWFVITHVQPAALKIQHNTMYFSKAYGADAVVLAVDQVKFFVDNTTDPASPNLMVQRIGGTPQIYAENVADLQFQYRLANNTVVDVPASVSDVREVIITVTAQGMRIDPDYDGGDVSPRIYTRTFTSSVNIRNI